MCSLGKTRATNENGRASAATFLLIMLSAMLPPVSAHAGSIVTEWLDEALPVADEVAWEPTVGARFFMVLQTAEYDTWAAYDPVASGYITGTAFKHEGGAPNDANKREAISEAAYTVLLAFAPHRHRLLSARMAALGYDPAAQGGPARLGREVAARVLAHFRGDGANQDGNYADTTGYAPRPANIIDSWQPIDYFGKRMLATSPHWKRVLPFALVRADQFRPGPPPAPTTPEWDAQIKTVISKSAGLTDSQKAAAEYWADMGSSPAPYLLELTKLISNTHDLRLDDDAKLFFAVAATLHDAVIAAWDVKYTYNYVRPITAIHALGDVTVMAWRPQSLTESLAYSSLTGPVSAAEQRPVTTGGIGPTRAVNWQPYLATPSFPSYVSGHSVFAAAWAHVMALATNQAAFNFRAEVTHLYVERRVLNPPVILSYPTFYDAANSIGESRIFGGVHWPVDNERGLALGREVGENAWQRVQQLVSGNASPATAVLMALRPPYWFHSDVGAKEAAHYRTIDRVAADIDAGSAAGWQSSVMDPVAAGQWSFTLFPLATRGSKLKVKAFLYDSNAGNAAPLATTEAELTGNPSDEAMHLMWTSDGHTSFAIRIEAYAEGQPGHFEMTAVEAKRVWHEVAGEPRYYEPSSAGH